MHAASDLFRAHPKNATRPAALWADVTTLLDWQQGPFTGIPRTLSSLLGVWLADDGLHLRACRFDPAAGYFHEVPREELRRVLSTAPRLARLTHAPGAARPGAPSASLDVRVRCALRPLFRALPSALQRPCRRLYGAARGSVRLLRRAPHALRALAARAPCPLPRPAPFAPRDVLLVAGGGWDHRHFCPALAGVRNAHGVRVVSVIYDLIPCLMPHLFPPQLPPLFRTWAARLLRLSDLVLTISEHSRRDLLGWAARLVPPANVPVEVVRLGVEVQGGERPVALPGEADRSFVLSVGTVEVRKNHALLYHAWRRLIAEHGDRVPPLVLAGAAGWLTGDLQQQIRRDPLVRGRIIHLSDVTDDELHWLYRHCRFSLYPSLYEGWGLPVAECLAHGRYCISSDATSLPEIAGDLIDYHDPLDLPACVRLVRRALFAEGFVEAREERIRREYRPTGWHDCAAAVLSLLAGPGPAVPPGPRPARVTADI
jgi:glycosyltransferase involved in cell wall biosynthesis